MLARIDHRLRYFLSQSLSPAMYTKLYSATRSWYLKLLSKELITLHPSNYKPTSILGLNFRNDLGNAAGLDKDGSLLAFNYHMGAGFAIVGTVLNKPHTGNLIKSLPFLPKTNPWAPLPYSNSCLNSMGLPSKGYQIALDSIKKFRDIYQATDFPIGISIMGHPLETGQEKIDGVCNVIKAVCNDVDFIEINESCPNVKGHNNDGLNIRLASFVQARDLGSKHTPLLVKFGNVHNTKETIKILDSNNIDGITAVNTQTNYEDLILKLNPKDKTLFNYYTKNHNGGLSGSIINQHSFKTITNIATEIKELKSNLCLMHVGGITNNDDIQKSRAIAPLRQWYTGYMGALGSMQPNLIYKTMTK